MREYNTTQDAEMAEGLPFYQMSMAGMVRLDGGKILIGEPTNQGLPWDEEETMEKTLECHSQGDRRFSPLYAEVKVGGVKTTIEKAYQEAKRDISDRPVRKGPFDHLEIKGVRLTNPDAATAWYGLLWWSYLKSHPELAEYASGFDKFNDKFAGQAVNVQSDFIRDYVKLGEEAYAEKYGLRLLYSQINPGKENPFQPVNKLLRNCDNCIRGERRNTSDACPSCSVGAPTSYRSHWQAKPVCIQPTMPEAAPAAEGNTPYPLAIMVTGHRPHKLWGYNDPARDKALVERLKSEINRIRQDGPAIIISGMALGVDMAMAQAAVELQLPLKAFVPCTQQDAKWSQEYKTKYSFYLEYAKRTAGITWVTRGTYAEDPDCMNKRNKAMVDSSDIAIAVYDGQPSGGTYHCVAYLKEMGFRKEDDSLVIIHPKEIVTVPEAAPAAEVPVTSTVRKIHCAKCGREVEVFHKEKKSGPHQGVLVCANDHFIKWANAADIANTKVFEGKQLKIS